MLETILKYFALFFCSQYSINKTIRNQKNNFSFKLFLKAILLTGFTCLYKFFFPYNYLAYPFLLFVFAESVFRPNLKFSIALSSFSYCFNQVIFSLSSVLLATIITPFWNNYQKIPYVLVIAISSFLQPIFIILFFRIPKFKHGMTFLHNNISINLGVFICVIVFLCLCLNFSISPDHHLYAVLFQLIIIAMFIPLIIWWRHKIKESYLAYLREFELTQLHQQINYLSADNERLSRIVHKDNKLVSAMASSVLTLLEKAPEYDREEFLAQCDSLHKELSELSLHRQELLVSTTSEVSPLGNSHKLVESVLSYEVKNARHSGICTKYNIDNNFMAAIETYLTDEELAHILADMIQNAIIAMKATAQQNLLINLHMINGNPTISVMDSGTEFSPEVLQNLGFAPCSTHLDEGGSGIGLMDIWQIKVKSKASMVIKELPQPGDYTKQLSIIFDSKNKYVVFTNRKQELTKMINRFDMYIENI